MGSARPRWGRSRGRNKHPWYVTLGGPVSYTHLDVYKRQTELRFFSREMEKQYRESYSDPPEQNMKADGEVGGGGIAYERVANAKELLVIWVKYLSLIHIYVTDR